MKIEDIMKYETIPINQSYSRKPRVPESKRTREVLVLYCKSCMRLDTSKTSVLLISCVDDE